jgi:hypothetical protein
LCQPLTYATIVATSLEKNDMVDRHDTAGPAYELLPCPVCLRADMVSTDTSAAAIYQLTCESCGACGPPAHSWIEAAAVWNRRTSAVTA